MEILTLLLHLAVKSNYVEQERKRTLFQSSLTYQALIHFSARNRHKQQAFSANCYLYHRVKKKLYFYSIFTVVVQAVEESVGYRPHFRVICIIKSW